MVENSAKPRSYYTPRKPLEPITAERPVTTQQLADHLLITTRTLAKYRQQRLIPFWRINPRRILYRLSDVERALAAKDT